MFLLEYPPRHSHLAALLEIHPRDRPHLPPSPSSSRPGHATLSAHRPTRLARATTPTTAHIGEFSKLIDSSLHEITHSLVKPLSSCRQDKAANIRRPVGLEPLGPWPKTQYIFPRTNPHLSLARSKIDEFLGLKSKSINIKHASDNNYRPSI